MQPRTDIIDISTIKRPILIWWAFSEDDGLKLDILYPDGKLDYFSHLNTWHTTDAEPIDLKTCVVAWQYI